MPIRLQLSQRRIFKGGSLDLYPGVNLYVGANGAGKSAFLEEVFRTISSTESTHRVVVFTSGLNENFSSIVEANHKSLKRRYRKNPKRHELKMRTLYFSRDWAPLLITLAACIKPRSNTASQSGFVSNYLGANGYTIGAFNLSSRPIGITLNSANLDAFEGSNLLKLLRTLRDDDGTQSSGGKLVYHSLPEPQMQDHVTLNLARDSRGSDLTYFVNEELRTVIDGLLNQMDSAFLEDDAGNRQIKKPELKTELAFRLLAVFEAGAVSFGCFDISSFQATFNKVGECQFNSRELSDGELQLLVVFAMLDIFNDSNTVLVLDEVDSHVHQKILPTLWNSLRNSTSPILTSTHNPTSLKYGYGGKVRGIRNGALLSEQEALSEVSNVFDGGGAEVSRSHAFALQFKPKIVMIDDPKDWVIFLALAKIKLGDSYNSKIEEVFVWKKASSQDSNSYDDNNPKIREVASIVTSLGAELESKAKNAISLKQVCLLNDRDDMHFSESRYLNSQELEKKYNVIKIESGVKKTLDIPGSTRKVNLKHVFWNRRQIENYLLLPSKVGVLSSDSVIGHQASKSDLVTVERLNRHWDDEEFLAKIECKDFVNEFICIEGKGFSVEKLTEFLTGVSANEISGYIAVMHDALVEFFE